ncbi:MAG: type II secretion system protein, partial [Pseudonocardia sp.]|nr:type II secretion system protein [Pseudonocardia sp.]
MTVAELAAGLALGCLAAGVPVLRAGLERRAFAGRLPAPRRAPRFLGQAVDRRRALGGGMAAIVTWALTGWPVAGAAGVVATVWLPWLLGAGALTRRRSATLEALERWCRRLGDTLAGGGAIGLAQAVVWTAG